MTIERIYKGENYYSVQELRNEIFKDSGRIFGEEPKEGRTEFWAAVGVTYKETPDPVKPEPTPEELAAQELERKKRLRAAQVAAIQVTVDGMTFDGDEAAQSRMTRALQVAEITGLESTEWVLADNTVATVTVAQMREALSKAMLAMSELWTVPYEGATETDDAV